MAFGPLALGVVGLCELAVFYLFQDLKTLLNLLVINKCGRMHRSDAEAGESPFSKKTYKNKTKPKQNKSYTNLQKSPANGCQISPLLWSLIINIRNRLIVIE